MIVGTAGHIDHGKTALVRALTGIDCDRLQEEKERGITLDLGYAYRRLADPGGADPVLGFIDVPGHEKLIHNMLAGATGIDFALLVVAADDGPMPQTREHLEIIDLLGIRRGAVALTKTDLVDPARRDAATDEIRALLAGGVLASAGTALAGLAGPASIAVAAVGGVGLGLTALWKNCDGFREGVTNIWNKVTSVFSNGVTAIKNGISNAASAIGNVASSIWSGVKNAASSAVNWGKDVVSGIAGGIKKGVSWVGNAAKSVANGIRSFLRFSVPDEGPLADADTYMPDFMKLLTGGIKDSEGGLLKQIRSMASKVQQGMAGICSFSLPEINMPRMNTSGWNLPQAALAGGGTTKNTNLGGVHITVNGYNARNDNELAQIVADKINEMIDQDDSVYK